MIVIVGSFCDCKKSNYISPFVTKAAHAVAHPFFDMRTQLNLDVLKFPWNCSLTSATVGEASDAIVFTLPDGSKVADKYHELLNKAVMSMTGMKLMKGLDNKGPRMDLLVHPMTMDVNLVGQHSMRDMKEKEMSKLRKDTNLVLELFELKHPNNMNYREFNFHLRI